MKSSKPSILKHRRLESGREIVNRGRWSDMGGWAGGGVSGGGKEIGLHNAYIVITHILLYS